MNVIYKYPLRFEGDIAKVEMPIESEVLHVQMQGDEFFVWALVDTDYELIETYKILIKATGSEIPINLVLEHLNTFTAHQDRLVFHAFKVLF